MKRTGCLKKIALSLAAFCLVCLVLYAIATGRNLLLAETSWRFLSFSDGSYHDVSIEDLPLGIEFGGLPVNIVGMEGGSPYGGAALCNSFLGAYKITDAHRLLMTPPIVTGLYCLSDPQEARDLTSEYLGSLNNVTRFEIRGNELLLNYGDQGDYLRFQRH